MVSDRDSTDAIRARVVFENADVLVLDKPAGIPVQDQDGVSGWFNRVRNQLGLAEAFPVHRLDQGTSGLYLIARHREAARFLGQQFEAHRVTKIYLALSHAKGRQKQGWIIGDMRPARQGSYKLAHTRENPAVTWFVSRGLRPGIRAFALRLFTGKTHQARVALKSVGSPILGDARYGGQPADRLYLHAAMLGLELPGGERIELTCWPTSLEGVEWAGIESLGLLPLESPPSPLTK